MSSQTWLITSKTNLHVGNENTSNYGLIDKAVQRDVLTGLPCINSSSFKGAINEYCTQEVKMSATARLKVFGVDKNDKKKETQKGAYTFFDANLLLLPIQNDKTLYHWVTTKSIIKRFKECLDTFEITLSDVSDENSLLKKIETLYSSKEIKEVTDEEFKEYCADTELPIIARNRLEDGQSVNLWYEQVLPPETVFYTSILSDSDNLLDVLDNKLIQIGANATIGYGYCRLTEMK